MLGLRFQVDRLVNVTCSSVAADFGLGRTEVILLKLCYESCVDFPVAFFSFAYDVSFFIINNCIFIPIIFSFINNLFSLYFELELMLEKTVYKHRDQWFGAVTYSM